MTVYLVLQVFLMICIKTVYLNEFGPCESSPCLNGGSCNQTSNSTFICLCKDNFIGDTCNKSK